ncbi:splicing factor U2AF U2 snRNP auxiliary factor large subunit 3 RRM domains [Cryptosporidium sp. chipmunk genotype I]|uniref:splicing factor U2AF U2 snRNP auxiliary factor large subunit 3 RRM domains n=1 Tax=Cryptosporidium sp. chipmunk genotype I TaxID=1280935 RepID=UPI00351A44D0|nr:splicing factor U2AF U2 snRNP auxiliary factor large subunit 3 RRM domains [Cryptosporidium sp. chipmunk genotype I]
MQINHQNELTGCDSFKFDKNTQTFIVPDIDNTNFNNEIVQTNFKNNIIRSGTKYEHFTSESNTYYQENSFKKQSSNKYMVNCSEKLSDINQYESTEMTPTRSNYSNPALLASKPLREVYVGNLPQGTTVTELLEYINRSMNKNNVSHINGNPVISAWINSDGKYAFCECRSIEEANVLLRLNNLLSFKGNLLRIGKPKVSENIIGDQSSNNSALVSQITQSTTIISPYFNNIPLILKKKETILIIGINKTFVLENIKETFDLKNVEILELIDYRDKYKIAICELDSNTNINDRIMNKLGTEIQILKMKNFNSKVVHTINDYLKNMVSIVKENNQLLMETEQFKNLRNRNVKSLLLPQKPCRCILLSNILTIEELLIPSIYSSIQEEIHEKCTKYGEIYKTIIPKPERDLSSKNQFNDPYFGRAFIFFYDVESAIKAKLDLFKMRFLGRNIKISYYCEYEFLNGNLFSCEPNRRDPMDDKELSKIIIPI